MSRGLLRRIRYKGYFGNIGAKLRGVQLNKALVNYQDVNLKTNAFVRASNELMILNGMHDTILVSNILSIANVTTKSSSVWVITEKIPQ